MIYKPYSYTKLSNSKLKNYQNLNGIDFRFKNINPDFSGSKGGNSSVFSIVNAQSAEEEYAIKISNIPVDARGIYNKSRNARFEREIEALYQAKKDDLNNIVKIIQDGTINIKSKNGQEFELRYYVMEKAEDDLKEYILSDNLIDVQEKIEICTDLSNAINQLNNIDIYHRDIKPDNIFLINGIWKLGDLGLVDYRGQDKNIDSNNERIGPFGWHSPETMNKWLTENKDSEFEFDCLIDHQSDIYQLGMVFWFVFQGNAPIGQIQAQDFLCDFGSKKVMFDLINTSLLHGKNERLQNLNLLINQLEEIGKKVGIS